MIDYLDKAIWIKTHAHATHGLSNDDLPGPWFAKVVAAAV